MDELFAFLGKNIWIVFIIVAFLFSGLRSNKKPENKPGQRMPDFGGSGSNQPQQTRGPSPSTGGPVQTKPQQSRSIPANRQPERLERQQQGYHGQQDVYSSAAQTRANDSRSLRTAMLEEQTLLQSEIKSSGLGGDLTKTSSAAGSVHSKALTKAELRRAVIWSEILDRPRAVKGRRRY